MVLAAAPALALVGQALAADMPVKAPPLAPPPVYSWTGCHIGADIGYAWQHDNVEETVAATGALTGGSTSSNPHGIKGGGYLGCDWQWAPSNWVMGLEGDFEGADIGHSQGIFATGPDFYQARTHWQGSFRGRVGYAIDRSLLYVTGGLAFANIENTYVGVFVQGFGTAATTSITDTRLGWTVGAGWEYAFLPQWVGRIEYRHTDFGTLTNTPITFHSLLAPGTERHTTTEEAVRFGVAYRFGSPFSP
jgi:outer membrane immunogenic protein